MFLGLLLLHLFLLLQLRRTQAPLLFTVPPLSLSPPPPLSIPPLEKAKAYSSKSRHACSGTRPGPGPGCCQRWWNGLRLAGSFVHAPGETRRGEESGGEATVEQQGAAAATSSYGPLTEHKYMGQAWGLSEELEVAII